MSYLEELLPEFRKGAKIRCDYWYECKGKKYYFSDVFGLHQKEILSEDWEIVE